jgi:lipopolysaccharide biosynthesis glycosyltransferase
MGTGMGDRATAEAGRPIHVALTFDDPYWAPAFATMRSICLTTHRRRDLVFHLCHRTLKPEHLADFAKIADEFGSHLLYYDIDTIPLFASVAARAPYNHRLSNIVYARLLFAEIMPPEVTRLVYIDCDMMVRGAIEDIAEIDLLGNAIAAVPDPHGLHIAMDRDIRKKRDLFDPADDYFNAGLIVIDMAAWRDADILHRLEAAMADGTMARLYYDQDLLNLIFARRWLKLDQMWNFVDPRPIHQALNPRLLHYTGAGKPWKRTANVAFTRMYRHVMTNELYNRYAVYRWKRAWTEPFRKLAARLGYR